MRNFVKYALLFLNFLSALLLLLGRFIPSINPFEQSFIGILAYIIPVLAVINIAFLIFWLIARKYYFGIVSLIAIAFTWNIWSVYVGGNILSKQDFTKDSTRFSLMTYNVRLLDLYNWSGKKNTRSEIIDFFKTQNSDVLCLQEFYTGNDSMGFDNINAIKYACDYPYVSMCDVNVNKRGRWGSVLFSKMPIIQSINHDIDVKGSNQLQQVDLLVNNDDTVSIFNIHLKSNRFSSKESELVGKTEIPTLDDTTISRTKKIYDKVLNNTISRGLEAELVSNVIQHNLHKTIVCGDLNDIASSYVYFKMRTNLNDAFLEKGKGLGATYAGAIPLLRIDYLFFSKALKLHGFSTMHVNYSDHYPLKASFSLN